MIYLLEYLTKIEKEYEILDTARFRLDFSKFIVDNNWFGIEPVSNHGEIIVPDTFQIRLEKKLSDFCKYYNSDIKEKTSRMTEILTESFPHTASAFHQYRKEHKLSDEISFPLLDFLAYYLPGELYLADEKEIASLMNDGFDNLRKIHGDTLAAFINWVRRNYKTAYNIDYFMNTYSPQGKTREAYAPDEYLEMMYRLYNEDFILEHDMYRHAAASRKYVDTWLYLSLNFICALRNSDLVRIPHPKLTMKPEEVLEKVSAKAFGDEDARLTLYSILWNMSALPSPPNKTKKHAGIADMKFFVPESIEVHMGTLFAIAEAHFQLKYHDSARPLIRIITRYEDITRNMGDIIGELFFYSNFSSNSATKSYLQSIYTLTDDVLEHDNEWNVKGYILASMARSHKGSYGEFAKTTSIYLQDAKMSGYSPEFVARELFERGVLSFIPSMLLKMILGKDYEHLSVEKQTKMIQTLQMSPYEVETSVGFAQRSYEQSKKLASQIYEAADKDDVLRILHRIGCGNAASKQEGCLCLISAMHQICPYPEKGCCIGCQYEISTKATMYQMVVEYKRLLNLYRAADSPIMKEKYKTIAKELVLPSIDEMMQCVEELYGSEAYDSLEKIMKGVSHGQ